MRKSLLSNNTSVALSLLCLQPVGNTCDLRHRNGMMPSGKPRTLANMLL